LHGCVWEKCIWKLCAAAFFDCCYFFSIHFENHVSRVLNYKKLFIRTCSIFYIKNILQYYSCCDIVVGWYSWH
jgi:hypothetical protein